MYTDQDVRDAYFAYKCEEIASVDETTPESVATTGLVCYTDDNRVNEPQTREEKEKALGHLRNGQKILKETRLVIGERQPTGLTSLLSPDAPAILVDAGFFGTSPAYRQITLIRWHNIEKLNVFGAIEYAEKLGFDLSGRTLRYALENNFVVGAKTGRDWSINKASLENWLRNRPKPGRK